MASTQLEEYFSVERIHGWKQLNDLYEMRFRTGSQWIFRGQKNDNQGLKSSLEREIHEFGIDLQKAPEIERGLLRRFKRQCHHYTTNVPQDHDSLEWLALMRHYGAPTRLLDWTYSFFVAAYFAIEFADKSGCAVWAINTDWVRQPFEAVISRHPDALHVWKSDPAILEPSTFKALFAREPPLALVGAITPRRLNERLLIQQGIFLCPGDASKTFESNLIALLSELESESKANFVKITIDADLETKKDILLSLQRMNMNNAALFPGLAGFAQSLRTLMVSPETFLNPGNERL